MNPKINFSQAFLGMCLGDGYLHRQHKGGNAEFQITHGDNQIDYLNHKVNIIESFIKGLKFRRSIRHVKLHYTDKVFNNHRAYSNTHVRLTKYHDLLYDDNNVKIITKQIIRRLGTCGLAYWFGDNGTLLQKKNSRIDGSFYYSRPIAELCTDCFSYEDNINLTEWFHDVFSLSPVVVTRKNKKKNRKTFRLRFNVRDTFTLLNMIYPYMKNISCLHHKFIPKRIDYFTDGYPNNQSKSAQHLDEMKIYAELQGNELVEMKDKKLSC
jgi:hypothetical protein